jgi:hypothetical protein
VGLAFGITLSGVGVGNLIFSVVVQSFLDQGGWRYACQLMALIVSAGKLSLFVSIVIRVFVSSFAVFPSPYV